MNSFIFKTAEELIDIASKSSLPVWEVVLKASIEIEEKTGEYFLDGMKTRLEVMKSSIVNGLKINSRSRSGLSGGDALLLDKFDSKNSLMGSTLFKAVKYAFAIQEHNARFGRIVAFPTAGSAGTVPATLIAYQEDYNIPDEKIVEALFVAGGIGMITGENACLAGASGGCQAEVGTACAMASGALTSLRSATAEQIFDSCSIALKGMLGLVCDPIGGLVEAPCVKRNATAVANAYMASDVVVAGVESNVSYDEVVFAMRNIGDKMSKDLKETSKGGLAITKTGRAVNTRLGINSTNSSCGNCMLCR